MKWIYGINFGAIGPHKKMLSESKNCRSEKKGHRGHRKVECEISQALVMINLYVKLNVHSS